MSPRNYKITLDQLRLAARRSKVRELDPCAMLQEKVTNAMEAADFNIRPIYKYVKELEECYEQTAKEDRKKGQATTLYHLSKYLDRQKHKRK